MKKFHKIVLLLTMASVLFGQALGMTAAQDLEVLSGTIHNTYIIRNRHSGASAAESNAAALAACAASPDVTIKVNERNMAQSAALQLLIDNQGTIISQLTTATGEDLQRLLGELQVNQKSIEDLQGTFVYHSVTLVTIKNGWSTTKQNITGKRNWEGGGLAECQVTVAKV